MKVFFIVSIFTFTGLVWSEVWMGVVRVASHCALGEFDKQVAGEITRSKFRRGSGFYGAPTYSIKYHYFVDATGYTSSVVSCEPFTHKLAQRLKEFPVGQKVVVYYDSSFPQFSVLERRPDIAGRVFSQIIFCLTLIPLFVYFMARNVFGVGKVDVEKEP